jgi:hypothetical protein
MSEKSTIAALFLCAALLTSAQTAANKPPAKPAATLQNASAIHPPPAGFHLPDSVIYHYKAEWRLFSAGIVSLKIARGADNQEHITGAADATGVVARLYHVHDVFESTFNPATFCSVQIHKHTEEGFRRRDTSIRFDYGRGKTVMDDLNSKNNQRKHVESDIPSCVTDVLSGLIYNTSLPLQPGESYVFPINDGGPTSDLNLHSEAREVVRTPAGTYNTIRVQPTTNLALLKNKGKVWIWYSDDAERIPVQMRGRMGWGTLTLSLTSIEKLPAAKQ